MRTAFGVLTALFLTSTARADDAADAKALVEKAVKAHGYKPGDKCPAITWKDRGKFMGGGFELEYTGEFAFQAPDKYRFAVTGDFGGTKLTFTVVASGNKSWEAAMGRVEEVTGDKLDFVLNQTYRLNVTALLPLLSDAGYTLATAGLKDVAGKKAAGVKVTREKKPAVTLYFDRETGLLAKSETTVKDEFQGWKEVPEETYYSDYKDVGGKKHFGKMKVVRDGKVMIESAISDQKQADKLDAKLFEKP